MSTPRGYSSQSYSPGTSGAARSRPARQLDAGKSRERDDMVGLNDKFVMLIEKMKHLEDENKKLDTKLKILKQKGDYEGKIGDIVRQLEDELEQQIQELLQDQEKLQAELEQNQVEVEDSRNRYEKELEIKTHLENEFIVTKQEADDNHLEAVNLALELEDLLRKLDFLRVGHDEELKELKSQIQNETVLIQDNSKRSLDMDEIIESVKNQYTLMAARTREEAEHWNQKKMDVMVLKAGQCEQELRDIKREISDTLRLIQRLNGDQEAIKRKEESLKENISASIIEGDRNLEKAQKDIIQLEEALRRAKQDFAGKIREHQELMNLKLALDIEIATYRKLLEGEEKRMSDLLCRTGENHPDTTSALPLISKNKPTNLSPSLHPDVKLPMKQPSPEMPQTPEPTVVPATSTNTSTSPIQPMYHSATKRRLLIRVEVKAGKVVSESSHFTED